MGNLSFEISCDFLFLYFIGLTCRIEENNCLVYVIKSHKDDWSLEEAMEQLGCRVYSLLSAPRSDLNPPRNLSGSRIRFHWLEEGESVGQVIQQTDNYTALDYLMIRMDSGENEWGVRQIMYSVTSKQSR